LAHLLPAKNQFSPKGGQNIGEPVKIEGLAMRHLAVSADPKCSLLLVVPP
jgi:hypothetical protein